MGAQGNEGNGALLERAAVLLFEALEGADAFEPSRVIFVFDEPCDPGETLVMVELSGRRPVAGLEMLRPRVAWAIGLGEVFESGAGELLGRFEEEVMVGGKTREALVLAEAAARVSTPRLAARN